MPETLDAAALARAMDLYAEALEAHREEIDSLNVYPVPDGDTGTNLLLTHRAVIEAMGRRGRSGSIDEIGAIVSRASLMGARGNSGVILSQVFRGLFAAWHGHDNVGPAELVAGLEEATREAYRAVARPVEGTVLSVLRDAAGAAAAAGTEREANVHDLLAACLAEARASLERTREALPELRRAGVVDAGGRGLVLFFDALLAAFEGRGRSETPGPPGPVLRRPAGPAPVSPVDLEFPFEVQVLLEAGDEEVAALRTELARQGDSLVIVGGGTVNVHVHTDRPQEVVALVSEAGSARDVRVTDLREQVVDCIGGQARSVRVAEQTCAMVAVAEGEGLVRTFRSLGALVVPGGPGANPSVMDLLAAIEAASAEEVAVLPNHPNVVPAATQAAGATRKRAAVIDSRSVPGGLAAATEFNPHAPLDQNALAMREAVMRCRAGELARAERDADTPAGHVEAGEWLAMASGTAAAVGGTAAECALAVALRIAGPEDELLTLIVGQDASPEERRTVEATLRRRFPDLEVQVLDGGQPRYPFLIGVE